MTQLPAALGEAGSLQVPVQGTDGVAVADRGAGTDDAGERLAGRVGISEPHHAGQVERVRFGVAVGDRLEGVAGVPGGVLLGVDRNVHLRAASPQGCVEREPGTCVEVDAEVAAGKLDTDRGGVDAGRAGGDRAHDDGGGAVDGGQPPRERAVGADHTQQLPRLAADLIGDNRNALSRVDDRHVDRAVVAAVGERHLRHDGWRVADGCFACDRARPQAGRVPHFQGGGVGAAVLQGISGGRDRQGRVGPDTIGQAGRRQANPPRHQRVALLVEVGACDRHHRCVPHPRGVGDRQPADGPVREREGPHVGPVRRVGVLPPRPALPLGTPRRIRARRQADRVGRRDDLPGRHPRGRRRGAVPHLAGGLRCAVGRVVPGLQHDRLAERRHPFRCERGRLERRRKERNRARHVRGGAQPVGDFGDNPVAVRGRGRRRRMRPAGSRPRQVGRHLRPRRPAVGGVLHPLLRPPLGADRPREAHVAGGGLLPLRGGRCGRGGEDVRGGVRVGGPASRIAGNVPVGVSAVRLH